MQTNKTALQSNLQTTQHAKPQMAETMPSRSSRFKPFSKLGRAVKLLPAVCEETASHVEREKEYREWEGKVGFRVIPPLTFGELEDEQGGLGETKRRVAECRDLVLETLRISEARLEEVRLQGRRVREVVDACRDEGEVKWSTCVSPCTFFSS
jgi:capsid portal protein